MAHKHLFHVKCFSRMKGDFGCAVNVIEQLASTFNKFNLVTKLVEPTIVCWAFMDYLDAAKNSVLLLFTYCIHHRILAKELTSNRLFFVYFYQTDRSQKVKLSDLSCNAKQQYCAQPSWRLKVTSCLVIKMGSVFFLVFFNRLVTFDVPDIPHETNQFCHLFQDIRNAELLWQLMLLMITKTNN